MEISINNAKMFKDCVDALNILLDEGEFSITGDGVKLRAMDPSQIAMVDFVLPKHAFDRYEVPNETRISLNMDDLARIMGRVRIGEQLTLKLDESRLGMLFRGKSSRRFSLPLLDASGAMPREPKVEFDARIRISGEVLREGLKDASLVSSHVILRADSTGFTIEAHGDKGDVVNEVKKEEEALMEHAVKADARAMYPLEYLNDILKSASPESIVTLEMKADAPIRIEYAVGDATVKYYLAPRIETA